jgi:hypothetical protein
MATPALVFAVAGKVFGVRQRNIALRTINDFGNIVLKKN